MANVVVLWFAVMTGAAEAGELHGRVVDVQGAPLAGAVVDIYTAKPRVGLATTCPSCYRDCAKSTKTDAEGKFSIGDLDPNLLFRVLVFAAGRRAQVTPLVDPAEKAMEVKLEAIPADLPNDRMIRGRVLDERGKALAGAIVWPTGAKTHEKRWWGSLPGVDDAAVTDADGRFILTSKDSKLGLDLAASAPGFARFPAQLYNLDGSEHEIRMRFGANVSGRLLFEGKPVANRALGIVQCDRTHQNFVGELTLATGADGSFLFANLQTEQEYALYSLCDSDRELPVLKTIKLTTGSDGAIASLGDLSLIPGRTLTGRVEFPDGAAIPKGAKVRVDRSVAWDWCEVPIGADGVYAVRNLPPEVYSVSVIAPGFVLDPSRLRYQITSPTGFAFRLRSSSENRQQIDIPMKAKPASSADD